MHIECKACGWVQGDFWSAEDNPIRLLAEMEDDLLNGRLDQQLAGSTIRATAEERAKQAMLRIRSTKWRTLDEYKYDRNASCPVCGSSTKLAVLA
jgi:rubredoxin